MPLPARDVAALADRYALALASAPAPGRTGEHLARSGGAGTEFHDSRPYRVGDDVRSIDWRAFARTDQLTVRVWRAEVLAQVDVLLDVSRSMGVDPSKAGLAVSLAHLIASCARRDGCATRVVSVGRGARVGTADELERTGVELDDRAPFDASLREALERVRRGSIVVLVSDFLFPHAPRDWLGPLAAKAGALACVQILAESERRPPGGEALRLVDCEDGGVLDLVLDRTALEGYGRRLAALTGALEQECRRAHALFASLTSSQPLEALARGELMTAGVLAPR